MEECVEKVEVGSEEVQSKSQGEKYLEILIYKIEADWAYAMDMKKSITEAQEQPKEESKAGLKNQS